MDVKFQDLRDAFDFVNFGEWHTHEVYICRKTGRLYYYAEDGDDDDMEVLPDHLEDGNYVPIPHKSELNLGKNLALEFAAEYLPDDVSRVEDIFQRKGAYQRYKRLLESHGLLDKWYDYVSEAEERALRQWCEECGISLDD